MRAKNRIAKFKKKSEHSGCGGCLSSPAVGLSIARYCNIAVIATALVATCQSQGSHALKHTLLYVLFDSKWDHNVLNEHHAVLKKT